LAGTAGGGAVTSGGDRVMGVAKILIFHTQQILNSLAQINKKNSQIDVIWVLTFNELLCTYFRRLCATAVNYTT